MKLKNIPLKDIYPAKMHFRKTFSVAGLAKSIKEIGLLSPIIVRKAGKHYEIIDGHRRWGAYVKLKYPEIPCIVLTDIKDDKALMLHLSLNMVRQDLSLVEEANMYYDLWKYGDLSIRQISDKTGIPVSKIYDKLKALGSPPEVFKKMELCESRPLSKLKPSEIAKVEKEVRLQSIKETLAKNSKKNEIKFKKSLKFKNKLPTPED